MRRPLDVGQVGGGSWLLLSERGHSKVLERLLTQKEKGDLESGPCVGSTSFHHAWGTLPFTRELGEGSEYKAASPTLASMAPSSVGTAGKV